MHKMPAVIEFRGKIFKMEEVKRHPHIFRKGVNDEMRRKIYKAGTVDTENSL